MLVDAAVGTGFPVIAALIAVAEVTTGARMLGRVMLVSGVAAALAALCTALALVLPADAAGTAVLVQLQSLALGAGVLPAPHARAAALPGRPAARARLAGGAGRGGGCRAASRWASACTPSPSPAGCPSTSR